MRAEPVRGHRSEIISIGFRRAVTMLLAGRGGRLPSRLTRRPPALIGRGAVAPAVLLAVDGWSRGTHLSAARGISAAVRCRWLVFRRPGGADESDQEFIGAREADRWPGRDHRSDGTV